MARKRPIEDPPPASSSEEEESESDSDEEEEEKTPLKKQKAGAGKDGSDSESDSDKSPPSPNVSDFTIKPIVSKPNKSAPKPTPKTKHIDIESSSKRKKPSSSTSDGGAGVVKTPVTARRWSEADEITILKGLIEYKSKEGPDLYRDSSSGFHDFIKERFQPDVSKTQLNEKIRSLNNKYKANAEKGQNGNDPVLPNSHDRKCFQLSKKFWGNETNEKSNKTQKKTKTLISEDEDKTQKKTKTEDEDKTEDKEVASYFSTQISSGSEGDDLYFWKDYPCLKESFEIGFIGRWRHVGCSLMDFLERNAEVIGGKKLKEMEREWRQLRIDQLELYLKRGELVQEIAKAALDAIKGTEI